MRHKLTGEHMTIEKTFGGVAICRLEKPRIAKILRSEMIIDKVVCRVENLEGPEDQFKLFT